MHIGPELTVLLNEGFRKNSDGLGSISVLHVSSLVWKAHYCFFKSNFEMQIGLLTDFVSERLSISMPYAHLFFIKNEIWGRDLFVDSYQQ